MSITVIIPCYNEEGNLEKILENCEEFLNAIKESSILLVDNGSQDNTKIKLSMLLENLKSKENKRSISVVNIKKNIGYGHGIKSALKITRSDYVAWTHADLQCDIMDIAAGYKKIKNSKTTFVKGLRKNRNFFDNFFTKSMSLICSVILRTNISDINAQPKIFHKKIIDKILYGPDDFMLDLFTYYLLKKEGYKEENILVFFKERRFGIAKGGGSLKGKIKLSLNTIKYLLGKIQNDFNCSQNK